LENGNLLWKDKIKLHTDLVQTEAVLV